MLPFRLVYHERYDLNLGEHVFPSRKYRWLRERMLRTGFAEEDDFITPDPISEADLLLAHDAAWIGKLRDGTMSYSDILRLEIPYSRHMVEAFSWLPRVLPWPRGWPWNRGCATTWAADFTTRSRGMGKVSAPSTTWP